MQRLVLGQTDHRFRPMDQGMVEGTGVSGGFLLPQPLASAIFDTSLGLEVVRPRARLVLVPEGQGNQYIAPRVSFHDRETLAGIAASWIGEGQQAEAKALSIQQITGTLRKCMLLVEATNELISDAPRFEATLTDAMAQSLAWAIDSALVSGNGVGKPLGFLQCASLIEVPKVTGQAAGSVVFENIVDLWSRLAPGSTNTAIWIAHPSCLSQLMVLQAPVKNVAGTENVGGTASVFLQSAAEGVPSTLLGRPIIFSEHSPILGQAGDLALVDLQQFLVVVRPQLGVAVDPFSRFDADSTRFRLIARLDSLASWPDPVKPKGGAPTLSWCVKLGART